MQGSNNGVFTLTANANTDKNSRNSVLYINAGSASAMITVNQSGIVPETKVTITNNSTYSLYRFTVVFVNSRMESVDNKDFGTLEPGQTVTCDIPTGATEFYMATYQSGTWFISANYDMAYTNISLTNSMIGNWMYSSSINRDSKVSSASSAN